MSSWKMHRRSVLKGIGATIALPMLDAMIPGLARAGGVKPSPRFVAVYLNLGTYGRGYDPSKQGVERYPLNKKSWETGGMGVWQPANVGALTGALPVALAPLEAFKSRLTIVRGLSTFADDPNGTSCGHAGSTAAWLTSMWKTAAAAAAANVANKKATPQNSLVKSSVDQVIANALGMSPGSSLVLSTSTTNFPEVANLGGHAGAISFNGALASSGSTVLPRATNPQTVFDSLFGSCTTDPNVNRSKRSILDYVMGSVDATKQKVGVQDRGRLDAYFQHIRDLEQRLQAAGTCPTMPGSPGYSIPDLDRLHLLADVLALAVGSGINPIATLMTTFESDATAYAKDGVAKLTSFIGRDGQPVRYHAAGMDSHKEVSHAINQGSDDSRARAVEEHIALTQMNVHTIRRIAERLDAMEPEPNGGTPLDNTILLGGSCHAHSSDHSTHNLPMVLVGGGKFGLQQGQHIGTPMNTDVGNFYYTLAKGMGVSLNDFNGNSTYLSSLFNS